MAIHSGDNRRYAEPIMTTNSTTTSGTTTKRRSSILLKYTGMSPISVPVEILETTTKDASERNDFYREFVDAHKELESYK